MLKLRKILLSCLILLIGIFAVAFLTLYLKREFFFDKFVELANRKLHSSGYVLSYDHTKIEFFPPRLSLTNLKITALEDKLRVFEARTSYLYFNPLKYIIPGSSPVSIRVKGFTGKMNERLLKTISGLSGGENENVSESISFPTFELSNGFIEVTDPWKFIERATLSVDYLYFSGNTLEGIGIIIKTREEGVTGTIHYDEKSYPLQISNLHLNTHLSAEEIDIKKVEFQSPYGNLSLSGHYDLESEGMEGQIMGEITPDKLITDFHIKVPKNFIQGGKVAFSGKAGLKGGVYNLDIATEFFDLNIKGFECNGIARCIYENDRVSLKELALNTPIGKVSGKLVIDLSRLVGEGELNFVDFYPGKIVDFLVEDAVVGAEGKGNGHIILSSQDEGQLTVSSSFHMDKGFSLTFRNLNEKIEWTEPVDLRGEALITDILKNPYIEIKELVAGDKENRIAVTGNLDLLKHQGIIECDIDIKRVKSLGLKGIFARSDAIKGTFIASGDVSHPLIESSLSFNALSLSGLPEGNVLVKGSGILGGNISLIADYSSSIGNVTFTGTFFSDRELYFAGSLKAEEVEIGPFASKDFLKKERYDILQKRFPIIFPVTGSFSFEGEVFLSKENVRAKGKILSDHLQSPRMSLRSVKGEIEYVDGNLVIEDISCLAFGGAIRSNGTVGKNTFELFGNFSKVDPGALNFLFSDTSQIMSGESLDGAFHVKSNKDEFEKIDIHLSSEQITFHEAELPGLILDGKKEKDIFFLTLSTSSNIINLNVNYDLKESYIQGNLGFSDFPLKISDELFGGSLGKFAINVSGSAAIGLKNISKIPLSISGILFNADSLNMELTAAPYFSSSAIDLPVYKVAGKNKGKRINVTVASDESNGELNTLFSQGKEGDILFSVHGQINTGRFPFVLPSKILATMKSIVKLDFEGIVSSFLHKGSGRFVFQDLNIQFPGENINAEKIEVSLEEGKFTLSSGQITANQSVFTVSGRVSSGGAIDLVLSGEYDAGLVNMVVKDVFEKISGKVMGDIHAAGKFPEIEVSGQGIAKDVFIKFFGFKHPFENVSTNISFFKDRILFDSITSSLSGGDIEGSGEVNILKEDPVSLSFNADFYGVNLSYPEELPSRLEGSIELLGPVDDMFLRGELFVERALYSTSIYPEKMIVDIQKRIARFDAPIERGFAINLDLECISDGTIYIKNNIADSIARGSFRILGDTSRPIILGTFETVEGEIEFRGTEYSVERLLVDFDDPLSNNPSIDAFAKAEKGKYTIYVEVTGRLDDYSIELNSEPPLSKNDIVSLLSLGVTTEAFSESGSSVTTAGLATVALSPLKAQIEEGIRIFTGFERFSVESNYSTVTGVVEPTVVIGKTVGNQLSIDVSTSLVGSGTSNVVGEFRLIKDLYIRGDWTGGGTADEGELGGELRIKKRYHDLSDFVEKLFGGENW